MIDISASPYLSVLLSILLVLTILVIGTFRPNWFFSPGKSLVENEIKETLRRQNYIVATITLVIVCSIVALIGYSIYQEKGTFGILYYSAMALGVAAKWLWDTIKLNQNSSVKVDLYKLVLPLLISPIVFSSVISVITQPDGLVFVLFSFQNGFFWQTVFGSS